MAQAAVLKPGQYRHLLRVTKATSRDPERDVLVLLLGIHTGIFVEVFGCKAEVALVQSGCRFGHEVFQRFQVSIAFFANQACGRRFFFFHTDYADNLLELAGQHADSLGNRGFGHPVPTRYVLARRAGDQGAKHGRCNF